MKNKIETIGIGIIAGLAAIIGIWSFASLIGGVIAAGGIAPLIASWMSAVGLIGPVYTMVDFYTHIKGIEYIICAVFFVVFPLFIRYINKEQLSDTLPI